ncbi:MAG: hypothetical protein ABSF50_23445, partial [Burkholderiaceae bacterium]
MPKTRWRLNAGKSLAPICRKPFGSYTAEDDSNYVTTAEHALSDPYRYQFMPRVWKADNPMPNMLAQQWDRI